MTVEQKINQLEQKYNALQLGLNDNEMMIREGVMIKLGNMDSKFGFEFFSWRSPEMASEMDSFVKYANGKKCFVDIGAFHGIFSLVFNSLNQNYPVLAFEPSSKPHEILIENCKHFDNIHCLDLALSDKYGEIKMSEEWEHLVVNENGTKNILSVSFDSWCNGRWKPDIIKIDVEGAEIEVLKGMRKTIENLKPIIFLEIHPTRLKEKIHELISLIKEWSYKIIDTQTENEIEIDLNNLADQRLILIP